MHQRDVWSVSLCRWGNVHVRVHIFFVLFGILTTYLAWLLGQDQHDDGLIWLAILSVTILIVSVFLHELGHWYVATRLGGHNDTIVLWPLGGLRPIRVANDPQSELLAVLAGPAVSVGICLFCLLFAGIVDPLSARKLLRLFDPTIIDELSGGSPISLMSAIRLTCWINFWLLAINFLPAFPFDGGRALTALLQIIRPRLDYARAVAIAAMVGRMVAVGLCFLAFTYRDHFSAPVPVWLALLLLAVFIFFAARVEEAHAESESESDDPFGYDFSQGYTSLERSAGPPKRKTGSISRWIDRYRQRQRDRQAAVEAAEEKESDDILKRLHEHGMESLSHRDRALLKRVSERIRSRNLP